MRRRFMCALVLVGAIASVAWAEVPAMSARVASGIIPLPTFAEVHQAFMRLAGNESGFKNIADQDGISQSVVWASGGRKSGRSQRGQGYGLDYTRLMRQIVLHARTVPNDDKFLVLISAKQAVRAAATKTYQNKWASTLTLGCSRPTGWQETSKVRWIDYRDKCLELRASTKLFLVGKTPTNCNETPTTWGSEADANRKGGPIDEGWREVHCNQPKLACSDLDPKELIRTPGCAKNRFWTWLRLRRQTSLVSAVSRK